MSITAKPTRNFVEQIKQADGLGNFQITIDGTEYLSVEANRFYMLTREHPATGNTGIMFAMAITDNSENRFLVRNIFAPREARTIAAALLEQANILDGGKGRQ